MDWGVWKEKMGDTKKVFLPKKVRAGFSQGSRGLPKQRKCTAIPLSQVGSASPRTAISKNFSDISLTTPVAGKAVVFSIQALRTHGGWLVLDQSLLYQSVSRILKDVQPVILDAALEKAIILFTVFGKLGPFLQKS